MAFFSSSLVAILTAGRFAKGSKVAFVKVEVRLLRAQEAGVVVKFGGVLC